MTEQKVRVGLIGVGGICGYVHYPGLEQIREAEVVGLGITGGGFNEPGMPQFAPINWSEFERDLASERTTE